MGVVGPGAQQAIATDIKPMLDGASELEVITVFNPLTDDFAVRVAQDVPVNMQYTAKTQDGQIVNESQLNMVYGAPLRNRDFQAKKHITMDTVIRAGETHNFRGNEAQVAVRQIVNELMQREGNGKLLSDPTLRSQAEARVVKGRRSIQDIMDSNIQTPRAQVDAAIAKSNEVVDDPRLGRDTSTEVRETGEDSGADSVQQERRGPGRPKRA